MNVEQANRSAGAAIGFLIATVLFVALALITKYAVNAPAIDADRGAVRSQALAEIRSAEETALTTSAVLDSQRGIIRLPIDTAMQLTAQKWQNPAAARADLNSRAEKAVAPVQPASFE